MRFSAVPPMLRAHEVHTLEDRVLLLRKLAWWGARAFDPKEPPIGSVQDPNMRQIGLEVTSACRGRDDMCELQSIYWFTKQNIRYTGDITNKDTFQSAWRTLQYAGGDCLPVTTKLLRYAPEHQAAVQVELGDLRIGDSILEDGRWVKVLKYWLTGEKEILSFSLSTASVPLRCSGAHRLILIDGTEIRAQNVRVGQHLLTPQTPPGNNAARRVVFPDGARVDRIDCEGTEPCADITTETGRFWLPDADVIVHNCDDHAVLNAVLCMENGFMPRFRITSNTGASWDHIYTQAGLPKNSQFPSRWITIDTTLPSDRNFNVQPPYADHKDFLVTEPRL